MIGIYKLKVINLNVKINSSCNLQKRVITNSFFYNCSTNGLTIILFTCNDKGTINL